jgi:uncharacterized membrane protein
VNPITPDTTREFIQKTGNMALAPEETTRSSGDRVLTPRETTGDTGSMAFTPKETTRSSGDRVLTPDETTGDTGNRVLTPEENTTETGDKAPTPKERRTPPHFVLAYFLLPFLFVGVYVWILYILLPYEQFLLMTGLMLAYLIPPAGKETVIPLGIALGLPWYVVATSVAMADIGAAFFMAWNFDLALKIPILGPWIGRFMFHGQEFVRQRPWLERLYFVGLALFVMFPLQGSGGIGASIVGRILGMPKAEVVAAIAIGAFAGSFLLALGVEFLKDILLANLAAGIAVILTVVVVVVILYLYSRERKKSREKKD